MTRKELILQILTEFPDYLFDEPITITPSEKIMNGASGYDVIIKHCERHDIQEG